MVVFWTIRWPFFGIPVYQLESVAVTVVSEGVFPVTVAVLVNGPPITVPEAEHSIVAPADKDVPGHVIATDGLSVTEIFVKVTLPVFCTIYFQETGSSIYKLGPGAAETSWSLTFLTKLICGFSTNTDERCPTKNAELSFSSSVINASTAVPVG